MGREVRRVPANWQHPKDENGHYRPLLKRTPSEWDWEKEQWDRGLRRDFRGGFISKDPEYISYSYEEWAGTKPDPSDCMPEWAAGEKTHYQMYETCTEGTPISPVMDTAEALAHWLAESNASAFAGMGATYENWLATILAERETCSAVMDSSGIRPGVEDARGRA